MSTTTMDVALEYATERRWRVIPIRPGYKYPKGFLEWQDLATTDVEQIEAWWKRFPNDGIGIATGPESGVWVLDIDTKDGKVGDKTLADLEAVHGELPETYTVQSGSGGWHYYFRWDPNRPIDNGQNLLGPDIDCLADGAQVVAPPTPYPVTGTPYRVHLDVPLAETPQWIYDLLQASKVGDNSEVDVPVKATVKDADLHPLSSGVPSVWDDYNAHTTWDDILTADGWVKAPRQPGGRRAGETDWVRPGKNPKEGSSATVGHNGSDTLKVFTTSMPELTTDGTHTRYGYYAAVQHGGDFDKADTALKAAGYGSVVKWIEDRPDTAADPPADLPEGSPPAPARDRFVDGATFILDGPTDVPAIWGDGDQVLWASGEPCIITGPPGVGKTTLVGQIVAGRLGLSIWPVLGLPIVKGRRVLYLASDRPQQIRRSLARQFTGNDRQELAERLTVWTGPPPGDFAKNPKMLAEMCAQVDADTVIIDSLKDVAIGLSDDEVGAGLNSAIQEAIANDVEVLALHHQRKGTNGAKPRTLEDVYGSTWITAGAGSVVLLWGTAGDLVVELLHLKQPADTVGPWKIEHDHDRGITTIAAGTFDLLTWLQSQPGRVTAADVAKALTGKTAPTDNDARQARRKLDKLVEAGHATKIEGITGGPTGTQPARYQSTKEVA